MEGKLLPSPFLQGTRTAEAGTLAVLHLRRDRCIPTVLAEKDEDNEGYEEGKVTNTRFGSFPHSTLIGVPWGSQVRASMVDTGSRGWKASGKKRKREEDVNSSAPASDPSTPQLDAAEPSSSAPKAATAAQTGFAHLLPPTPEIWTLSLPHRTQVVYTPDYSLILQRLRALPGIQLIEAGAGSGSFSHAAARSVFSGCPTQEGKQRGKVWSFEFHEPRALKLQAEIREHGLDGVVQVTHRDVYEDGFSMAGDDGKQAVEATAVFLDLPAPWLALPKLTRGPVRREQKPVKEALETHAEPATAGLESDANKHASSNGNDEGIQDPLPSDVKATESVGPLSADFPVHICCFLPCIEQVQKTVTALQSHSWQEISVVDVAARRIEIRRERVGIQEEGLRGVNATPASVDEALVKLREAEERTKIFHLATQGKGERSDEALEADEGTEGDVQPTKLKSKQERLQEIKEASEQRPLYREGTLVHRAEAELKTHTSYLVFAVLPREWTDADEANAREKWGNPVAGANIVTQKSKKQLKKEKRMNKAQPSANTGA